MGHPPLGVILGPTASGKTAISLAVAQLLGGPDAVEIVSADAMQLYRGMDIGTAKLPVTQRQGIPHHQLDVLDIAQSASVAAYQEHARADIDDIWKRGKIPLLVGGSGLYISAVTDRLDFPGTDESVRGELEHTWKQHGLEPLISELAAKDPVSAQTINLRNPRRVIRALEVVRLTGESYTPKFPRHTSYYDGVVFLGVNREKDILNAAIERRAHKMFDSGLVEETSNLLDQGLRQSPTASKATGYAESIAVIDGQMNIAQAIESVAFRTRRLAKKQRTWFRADSRITWWDLSNTRDSHDEQENLNTRVEYVAMQMAELLRRP